jgi:hypothetical protein
MFLFIKLSLFSDNWVKIGELPILIGVQN